MSNDSIKKTHKPNGAVSYLLDDPSLFQRESIRLRLQAKKLFLLERPSLKLHGVDTAKSILELGCGNGAFLVELRHAFPGVKLSGADRNESLLVQGRLACDPAAFYCLDLSNAAALGLAVIQEQPDLLLARYVLQHMSKDEYGSMLQTVRAKKQIISRLLLMDTDDGLVRFEPHSSAITELLRRKQEKQVREGGNRKIGAILTRLLHNAGFQSIVESQVEFSSSELGWDDWEAIFWPVISAAAVNTTSVEDLALLQEGREWFKNARTSKVHYASFTIVHASGI